VAVEGPAMFGIETFGGRFGNIVHDGRPAQPEVVAAAADVVQHFQGVIKIVLVALAVQVFHALQEGHFGQDEVQQAGIEEQFEAHRGPGKGGRFSRVGGRWLPLCRDI